MRCSSQGQHRYRASGGGWSLIKRRCILWHVLAFVRARTKREGVWKKLLPLRAPLKGRSFAEGLLELMLLMVLPFNKAKTETETEILRK